MFVSHQISVTVIVQRFCKNFSQTLKILVNVNGGEIVILTMPRHPLM